MSFFLKMLSRLRDEICQVYASSESHSKITYFLQIPIYIVIFAFNMPDKTASGLQNEVRLRICTLLHFHSLQVVGFAAIEDIHIAVTYNLDGLFVICVGLAVFKVGSNTFTVCRK